MLLKVQPNHHCHPNHRHQPCLSPLILSSTTLKVELGDERRPSDRRQPNHVALPHYVPWLPRDDSTRLSQKHFSVR